MDPLDELLLGEGEQPAVGGPLITAIQQLAALPSVYLVCACRSHLYPQLKANALGSLLLEHRLDLPLLTEERLYQAIVKPAEIAGVFLESALVERLVANTAGEPGGLPILQAILVILWDKLERRYLSLHAFETIVLPSGAYTGDQRTAIQRTLALLADNKLAQLPSAELAVARTILVRLVQFGNGHAPLRRQQPAAALRTAGYAPPQFERVLNSLSADRLITLSGAIDQPALADLAHQGMIQGWPKLAGWIAADQENEGYRRDLEARRGAVGRQGAQAERPAGSRRCWPGRALVGRQSGQRHGR